MVGPHPDAERVIVAAGLGGVGIMLSPAVGKMVADWVVDGRCGTVSDAHRLSPSRFTAERAQ